MVAPKTMLASGSAALSDGLGGDVLVRTLRVRLRAVTLNRDTASAPSIETSVMATRWPAAQLGWLGSHPSPGRYHQGQAGVARGFDVQRNSS